MKDRIEALVDELKNTFSINMKTGNPILIKTDSGTGWVSSMDTLADHYRTALQTIADESYKEGYKAGELACEQKLANRYTIHSITHK